MRNEKIISTSEIVYRLDGGIFYRDRVNATQTCKFSVCSEVLEEVFYIPEDTSCVEIVLYSQPVKGSRKLVVIKETDSGLLVHLAGRSIDDVLIRDCGPYVQAFLTEIEQDHCYIVAREL